MNDIEKKIVEDLQNRLNITFFKEELLFEALVHTSYYNEQRQSGRVEIRSNERLEFLGDAVVDLLICEILYKEYPDLDEGMMAKIKAAVASEEVLSDIARSLKLGSFLFLGKGEEKSGGRMRNSILADTLESLIAAIYMDLGYEKVKELFWERFRFYINEVLEGRKLFDYKTALQEITQKRYHVIPEYALIKTEGKGHDKVFFVEVRVKGETYGKGIGKSKKEAEKKAAKEAYEKLVRDREDNTGFPSLRGM